jgi:hypothetical protein
MTTVTTAITEVTGLAALRQGIAETKTRAYGAVRLYAAALNVDLPEGWFNVERGDVSDMAKVVNKEKDALIAVLKAAQHSNPYQTWAQVRKIGAELVKAELAAESGDAPDGEGEESGGAKHTRSAMLRNVEELSSLYKFNKRQESLDAKVTAAQGFIASALMALGIDLSQVESGK